MPPSTHCPCLDECESFASPTVRKFVTILSTQAANHPTILHTMRISYLRSTIRSLCFRTSNTIHFPQTPAFSGLRPTSPLCQRAMKPQSPRQSVASKIIPARDPKQCCGVFLLEIVDAKSVSGSLHQNPVVPLLQDVFVRISASAASIGPLVQDLGMRMSCPRSLFQDLCAKIL